MPLERADSIVDLASMEKEITAYVALIQKAQDKLVDLYNTTKQFKDSNIVNLTHNTEKLGVAMDGSLQATKAVAAENEKLITTIKAKNEAYAKSKFVNDQEIKDNIKAREVLKARTDAIRAQGSAYQGLLNEYNKQTKALKDMAAAQGLHSEAVKKATANLQELDKRIKSIDQLAGQHQKNVGNYGSAWEKVGFSIKGLGPFFGNFKETLHGMGAELVAAGVTFFGLRSAFSFLKSSVEEFSKAEIASTRLRGILSNMGRSEDFAGINRSVKEMAENFKTIKQEDITDVFQRLYTYGRLSSNQMKELVPVIIDLASKQGIDLTEATGLVTKALEGNNRGLRDYGIHIKEGKDETERFGIIMDQLKPKVQGAEQLFETSFVGGIKKTRVEIDELQKGIGERLVPTLKVFFDFIYGEVGGLKIWVDLVGTLITRLKNFDPTLVFKPFSQSNNEDEILDKRAKKLAQFYFDGDQFAKKDLKNQQNLLQTYKWLLGVQEKQYHLLVNNPKTSGTAATAAAKERIDTQKYLIQLAHDAITGNQVVDPHPDAPKEKKLKEIKDYAEEFKKILNSVQEFNQKAFGIDVTPLQKELNAAFEEYDKFYFHIKDVRDVDLKEIDKNEKEKNITAKTAADQRKTVFAKSDQDLIALEKAFQDNIAAIKDKFAKEAEKKRKEQDAKNFAEQMKQAKLIEQELQQASDRYFSDKVAKAKSKAIDSEQFDGFVPVKDQKAIIEAETQQKLASLNQQHNALKISDEEYNYQLKQTHKDYSDATDAVDRKAAERAVDNVRSVVDVASKLWMGLADIQERTQLNALQRIENQQQKNFANQVRRINASTLTEEQKAAKLKELDSQRQVQTDENERKRRQIEYEKAKTEKAQSIVSIILNTAAGVAKAIPNPLLIALAAATGAVELGIASATPLPAYAEGIFGDRYHPGGKAVLGDAYKKELVIEPGKEPYFSPAVPTVMNLAKYAQVIPLDVIEEMRLGSMRVNPYGHLVVEKDSQVARELRGVKEAIFWQTGEMKKMFAKNKSSVVNKISLDTKWGEYLYKNVRR